MQIDRKKWLHGRSLPDMMGLVGQFKGSLHQAICLDDAAQWSSFQVVDDDLNLLLQHSQDSLLANRGLSLSKYKWVSYLHTNGKVHVCEVLTFFRSEIGRPAAAISDLNCSISLKG